MQLLLQGKPQNVMWTVRGKCMYKWQITRYGLSDVTYELSEELREPHKGPYFIKLDPLVHCTSFQHSLPFGGGNTNY